MRVGSTHSLGQGMSPPVWKRGFILFNMLSEYVIGDRDLGKTIMGNTKDFHFGDLLKASLFPLLLIYHFYNS